MIIEERLEFQVDPALVWKRLADVDRIPEYWHGTKSLEVVRTEGGKKVARLRFAFGGSGEAEISVDEQKKTLLLNYLSGPFTGTQTVRLDGKAMEARWEIRFRGLFSVLSSWNEGHFRSGTKHALERLTAVR